jgi:hypothetical protein
MVEAVDKWIEEKAIQAKVQAEAHKVFMQASAKWKGRPTKAEERKKRQNGG